MADIDRRTGQVIDNLASAFQSVEIILTTRLSSIVMLREFGGGSIELLGRALVAPLFSAWMQLVATAIDLWEPRFVVRRVTAGGSVDEIRTGTAGLSIDVDYRPRAHLGDFTVERVMNFTLLVTGGTIRITGSQ